MVTWVMFLAMGILIGVALGIYVSRLDDAAKRKQNALTQELQLSQTELAHYKNEVKTHFITTSKLVNDMTESYRAVHEHLSKGAENLCDNNTNIETISFKDTKMLADAPSIKPAMEKQNNEAGDIELGVTKIEDANLGEIQTESMQSAADIQPAIQEVSSEEETAADRVVVSDSTVTDPDSTAEKIQITAVADSNTTNDSSPDLELEGRQPDAGTESKSTTAVKHVDITESELSEIEQSRISASRMVH